MSCGRGSGSVRRHRGTDGGSEPRSNSNSPSPQSWLKVPYDRCLKELSESPNVMHTYPTCNLSFSTPRMERNGTASSLLCTPQTSAAEKELRCLVDEEVLSVNCHTAGRPLPPCTACIAPFLYVGSYPTDASVPVLLDLGITHVINVCGESRDCGHTATSALPFAVHIMQAVDAPDYYILTHDYDAFENAMDTALSENGRVFVHCIAGVNRSITLCIAYMVRRHGFTLISAIRQLRGNGRHTMLDNPGFRRQLVEFYLDMKGRSVSAGFDSETAHID